MSDPLWIHLYHYQGQVGMVERLTSFCGEPWHYLTLEPGREVKVCPDCIRNMTRKVQATG